MTKAEYSELEKEANAAIAMITAYLDFAGGSNNGTISSFAMHMNETKRNLIEILQIVEPTKKLPDGEHTRCFMFSEIESRMKRLEKLNDKFPDQILSKADASVAVVKSDLSNAIRSFKHAVSNRPGQP